MALVNDLAKSIQILNNQIEGILRPLDYESDNIILNDENPDQRFLRNEYGSIVLRLTEIHTEITYLNKPIIEEGILFKNISGRYAISEEFSFTCGSLIEVLINDDWDKKKKWVLTRLEHTNGDYYLYDYKKIKLRGLLARRRG